MESVLKQERATAKGQFTRKVNLFDKSLNNKDHIDVLSDLLNEVNEKFLKLETIHDKLLAIQGIDTD